MKKLILLFICLVLFFSLGVNADIKKEKAYRNLMFGDTFKQTYYKILKDKKVTDSLQKNEDVIGSKALKIYEPFGIIIGNTDIAGVDVQFACNFIKNKFYRIQFLGENINSNNLKDKRIKKEIDTYAKIIRIKYGEPTKKYDLTKDSLSGKDHYYTHLWDSTEIVEINKNIEIGVTSSETGFNTYLEIIYQPLANIKKEELIEEEASNF